jgi:RHS repeat-associated protein
VQSPFRLLGQVADEDAELGWTRFRCFDAETGKWLSPDPLGLNGGFNLFGFGPSPSSDVDPLGLAFYRGAKSDTEPTFSPRPNEVKVRDGKVQPTHGVSVFDNEESVQKKGFEPHEIDESTVPATLKIEQ